MDNKDTFLSVDNMKICLSVFSKFMKSEYNFDVETDGSKTNLKKLMFDIMQDTNERFLNTSTVSKKDMNNITLNVARDYYKQHYKLNNKDTKPSIQSLEREQNLYGTRILNLDQLKPLPSSVQQDVNKAYEKIGMDRREESTKVVDIPTEFRPVIEKAYDPSEFQRRMEELEKKRGDVEIRDLTSVNEKRLQQDTVMQSMPNDPKKLYELSTSQNNLAEKQRIEYEEDNRQISRLDLIAPHVSQQILIDKFLSINGFDRRWTLEPRRFSFKVDFNYNDNSIQQRFRNIKSIKVTRVIIPMEIEDHKSIFNNPKQNYNYDFGLSYPYLLLNIDEFSDVYDGTNQSARNCFCHLVFDKCYKAKNGRGYIVLNTIQGERKIFHPTPLSSLNKMSLSLSKPNGELLNNSKDEYKVFMVEYDSYNKQYFKIVTDKYYDKNEFYKGDTVLITNYVATNSTTGMTDEGVRNLNAFINRSQGHEIVEMGQANDQGFYRNFYIIGQGDFDETAGCFCLDEQIVTNLNLFNSTIDFNNFTGFNGSILNSSLQFSATFKMQIVSTDPGIIDTSYFSSQKI